MTPNLMRTMARSPAVLEAYLGFGKAVLFQNPAELESRRLQDVESPWR